MKTKFAIAILALLVAVPAHAQTASQKKRESYRRYNERQAQMERELMQMEQMRMQAAVAERRAARAEARSRPRVNMFGQVSPAPNTPPWVTWAAERAPKGVRNSPYPDIKPFVHEKKPGDGVIRYYKGPHGDVLPDYLIPKGRSSGYRYVGAR